MNMTGHSWSLLMGAALLGVALPAQADIDPRTGRQTGDVGAQNFAEFCEYELPAQQQKLFFKSLGEAEKAIAAQREAEASRSAAIALGAVFRGGPETDTSVKCLGKSVAERWNTMRLALFSLQNTQQSDARVGDAQLFTAANEGGTGQILNLMSDRSSGDFRAALGRLKEYPRQLDAARSFGVFILPRESSIATAFRGAIGPLQEAAAEKSRAALQAEELAFNRTPTQQELAMADSALQAGALAQAMAGLDSDNGDQRESMLAGFRISQSQEALREARDWDLTDADSSTRASSQRARQRGEALLEQGNETSRTLELRDELYRASEWYFSFGGFDQQAGIASSQRAAIQPALKSERAAREQKLEAQAEVMQQRAESVQQAVDDMQKTDAEKQSFNKEAEALEAELGF